MDQNQPIYLLSIRGVLAPKTLEEACSIHNGTAGAPANVAAAKSLGDLSHMVYVPLDHPGHEAGEFLILDLWNNLDGLNKFFANPQVQHQGGMIFSQRDPVVWQPAADFVSYHLPAPAGKNERYIGVVRGPVRSIEEARAAHNRLVGGSVNLARANGSLSHDAYLRLAQPGTPEALEFFAVDVWMNQAGMNAHYDNPDFMQSFETMFAAEPDAGIWTHPAGQWVEW
jgi:quinol monooxygenase YgiN